MNAGFAAHPVLTLVHILPGLPFMLLAPLQFVPTIRRAFPDCTDGSDAWCYRSRW